MPLYDYYCETCRREVTLAMTIGEHDRGSVTCPGFYARAAGLSLSDPGKETGDELNQAVGVPLPTR